MCNFVLKTSEILDSIVYNRPISMSFNFLLCFREYVRISYEHINYIKEKKKTKHEILLQCNFAHLLISKRKIRTLNAVVTYIFYDQDILVFCGQFKAVV